MMFTIWMSLLSMAIAETTDPLTVYITEALENNAQLRAEREQVLATKEQQSQVRYLPEPTVSIGVFASPIETKVGPQQAKIGVSQRLPWFGTRDLQHELAGQQVRMAENKVVNAEQMLVLELKQLWYPMVERNQRIVVLQRHQKLLSTVEQVAERRLEGGSGALAELIRLDIQQAELDTQIQIVQQEETLLRQQFNLLCNADINRVLDLSVSSKETVTTLAESEVFHPTLEAIQIQQAQLQLQEQLAKKSMYPSVSVGVDAIFVGDIAGVPDTGQDALMPMVAVQLPIYRSKYRAELSEIQHRQESTRWMLTAQEQTLEANRLEASFTLNRNQEMQRLYQEQLERTQKSLDLLLGTYSASGTEFESLLQLERQLLIYETQLLAAERDIAMSAAEQVYLAGGQNVQ